MSYPTSTSITYSATASCQSPYNGAFTYTWTFNDDASTQTGASVTKSYSTTGIKTATLSVANASTGETVTAFNSINVADPYPSTSDAHDDAKAIYAGGYLWVLGGQSADKIEYSIGGAWTTAGSITSGAGGQNYYSDNRGCVADATNSYLVIFFNAGTKINIVSLTTRAITGTIDLATAWEANAVAVGPEAPALNQLPNGKVFAAWIGQTGEVYSCWIDPATATLSNKVKTTTIPTLSAAFPNPVTGDLIIIGDNGTQFVRRYTYSSGGGAWDSPTATNRMVTVHGNAGAEAAITRMSDGNFLITGGSGSGSTACTSFNPSTLTFTAKTVMGTARHSHGAVLLVSGRVFVCGGYGTSSTGEVYNPTANTWTAVTGTMSGTRSRMLGMVALMPSGNAAICNGSHGTNEVTVEFYHPFDNKFYAVD